jgi:hypothetical protein
MVENIKAEATNKGYARKPNERKKEIQQTKTLRRIRPT